MAEIYRPDKSYPANLTPGYRRIPMKGATKIELGHAVSVVAGFAKIPAAADAATGHVAGIADETVDNTAGADGDLDILVRGGGIHNFAASGANVPSGVHLDKTLYFESGTVVGTDSGSGVPGCRTLKPDSHDPPGYTIRAAINGIS